MTDGTTQVQGLATVITGSTRGLGRSFAAALAHAGANVVVNGTNATATDAVVAELRQHGANVEGMAGSVSDDGFCRELIDHCVSRFGTVDVLINNAGITRDRSFTKMSPTEFDEVIDVHLRGTWSCSSAAANVMRAGRGGRILNITSGAGLFGMFGQANYAAAKAGVIGLTRVMDLELYRYGIAVNCLAPVAATDMTQIFDTDKPTGVQHRLTFPPPESIAPIAIFLADAASQHIHGQCLSFDGTDLSLWSHPRVLQTWRRPSNWVSADFAADLRHAQFDYPHPDRWGLGAEPS